MRCEKEQLVDGGALPLIRVLLWWLVHRAMQPKMEGAGELQGLILAPAISETRTTLAQSLGLALPPPPFCLFFFLCPWRGFFHDNNIKKTLITGWGGEG